MLIPLANNGVEHSMVEPPSIDHLYRDPDTSLPIRLIVVPAFSSDPADNHWMVVWTVSEQDDLIIRQLQIVRETGYDHLTNWGAITVTADDRTRHAPKFSLGELTLSQRKSLEGVAQETPVMMPNGEWNCQHWVADVLEKAVEQDILVKEVVEKVLASARMVSL